MPLPRPLPVPLGASRIDAVNLDLIFAVLLAIAVLILIDRAENR